MGKAKRFNFLNMFRSLPNIGRVRTKMIKERLLEILLLFIILTFTCGCGKDNDDKEAFFHPDNLNILALAEINGFWNDVSIIDTSFGGGAGVLFEMHPGFLAGIGLFDDDQMIWVSVFSSTDTAIIAMESRISNVAAIIQKGTTDEINGTWWFLYEGGNSAVFVNQWNTIIEVMFLNAYYTDVESILFSTANELARRVDKQSD